MYLPNCQTTLVIALDALFLLFCIFINTTAYHLGRYEHSPPSTKNHHPGYVMCKQWFCEFLSAAEGQRPRNYSSCCCSWIFRLVYALLTSTTVLPPFFKYFKSIHCCSWIFHLLYALSTSTTVLPPICLNILNLSIHQSI